MPTITVFYIFMTSLLTSLLLVPHVSRMSIVVGGVDRADERKIHKRETPRLGGIAIVFGLLLSTLIFSDFTNETKGFLAGALVVFLTGLADDLVSLTPRQKLLGQCFAASLAVLMGGIKLQSFGNLFGLGEIHLGYFSIPMSIFAIMGLINAINLLDGLDGLAAGVCALASITIAVLAFISSNIALAAHCIALLGALVGFLKYNSYPARIFMGDCGSLLLGYCMGCFSIMLATFGNATISEATPLMILAVPIFDTIFVMIKRKRMGNGIFMPDNNHIHHRLLNLGVSHRDTVLIVYGFTYFLCALAVISRFFSDAMIFFTMICAWFLLYPVTKLLAIRSATIRNNGQKSLRSSQTFQSFDHLAQRSKLLIKWLIIIIIMLCSLITPPATGHIWVVTAGMACLTLTLIANTKNWGNQYLFFIVCINSCIFMYLMENEGRFVQIGNITLNQVSHVLFSLIIPMLGLKMFLRRRNPATLIRSPLEVLLLGIVIAVPVLPPDIVSKHHLLTVAGETVVIILAYKVIMLRQSGRNRAIILATLTSLVIYTIRHFI